VDEEVNLLPNFEIDFDKKKVLSLLFELEKENTELAAEVNEAEINYINALSE